MLLVVLLSPIWSLPAYSSKVCILIKQVLPVPVLIPVSCALPFSSCHCRDTFRLIDFIFSLFSFFFFPLPCSGLLLAQFQPYWKSELLIFTLKSPSPVLDCLEEPLAVIQACVLGIRACSWALHNSCRCFLYDIPQLYLSWSIHPDETHGNMTFHVTITVFLFSS